MRYQARVAAGKGSLSAKTLLEVLARGRIVVTLGHVLVEAGNLTEQERPTFAVCRSQPSVNYAKVAQLHHVFSFSLSDLYK